MRSVRRVFVAPLILYISGLISPLIALGPTGSDFSPQVQQRLADIESLRRTRPDLFAKVEPFYFPDDSDPFWQTAPPDITGDKQVLLKTPSVDLLHSDYKAAVAANLAAFAEVVTEVNWLKSSVRQGGNHASAETSKDLLEEYGQRIEAISKEKSIGEKEMRLLVEAAWFRGGNLPRFDPAYLQAWEYGLLKEDVPWEMKSWLARIVASFDDPRSVPILGQTVREGLRQVGGNDYQTNEPIAAVIDLILFDILLKKPARETAIEFSDTIRLVNGKSKDTLQRRVGRTIGTSNEWRDLLDRLNRDPMATESTERLREVVQLYGQEESNERN